MLVADLGQDRGLDHGRRDGVDQHARGGNFFGDRFGQADDARLRGRVGDGVRVAFLAGDRGDVDDAAGAGVDHDRDDGLAAEEYAGQVDVHDLLPLVDAQLPDRRGAAGDAGVVDQRVDASPAVKAARTAASQETGSVTSSCWATPRSPIAAAVALADVWSTSAIMTAAPSLARRRAIASPIPRAAPVTIAVCPSNRIPPYPLVRKPTASVRRLLYRQVAIGSVAGADGREPTGVRCSSSLGVRQRDLGPGREWSDEFDDAVRGLASGFLIGIPVVFTVDSWWLGDQIGPLDSLVLLAFSYLLTLAAVYWIGFRRGLRRGWQYLGTPSRRWRWRSWRWWRSSGRSDNLVTDRPLRLPWAGSRSPSRR